MNAKSTVLGGPFNEGWYWVSYNATTGYLDGHAGAGRRQLEARRGYNPYPRCKRNFNSHDQPYCRLYPRDNSYPFRFRRLFQACGWPRCRSAATSAFDPASSESAEGLGSGQTRASLPIGSR